MTDTPVRAALVTGGSRGIGRAIVEQLARDGCRLAVVATSEHSAAEGAAAARAAGAPAARAFACDVRDPARVNEIVAETLTAFGRLDVLVNNAGITRDGLIARMSDDDIASVIDVNLKGALWFCRAAARPMSKARGGSIVNVSSIVGLTGNAGQTNYAAAKAGVFGLTRALAAELGGRGVRVNAIAPGWIETDMTAGLPEKVREETLGRIPLARLGRPQDIAQAVAWLAGDASSYVTGATIVVDGGLSL